MPRRPRNKVVHALLVSPNRNAGKHVDKRQRVKHKGKQDEHNLREASSRRDDSQ